MAQFDGGRRPSSSPLRLVCQVASLFLFLFFIKNRLITTQKTQVPKTAVIGFPPSQRRNEIRGPGSRTAEILENPKHTSRGNHEAERNLLSFKDEGLFESIIDVHEDVGTLNLNLRQDEGSKTSNAMQDVGTVNPYLRQAEGVKTLIRLPDEGSKHLNSNQDALYVPHDEHGAIQHQKIFRILSNTGTHQARQGRALCSLQGGIGQGGVHQNGSLVLENIKTQDVLSSNSSSNSTELMEGLPCEGVTKHIGFMTACDYVKAIPQCKSASVIDYTRFFFCTCGKFPIVGYVVLTLWLLILFYSLGNTAADYFCCSLEKLSKLLKCPPTVAGVTLLPLGNGAPDVFASIAAFVGAGVGQVGLNSVLGGGVFVTTVVAGSVSLLVANSQSVKLDKRSFIRDVCFYLFTIVSLTVILLTGHVYLWSAFAFLSIYGIYAIAVAALEILKRKPKRPQWNQIQLLPFTTGPSLLEEDNDSIYSPLLDPTTQPPTQAGVERTSLPQWMWASNVAIYSQQSFGKRGETSRPLWGWSEEQEPQGFLAAGNMFVYVLQWPLSLPRRLTIPVVEDDRWSHKFALASAGLAPVFFALVLDSQEESTFGANKGLYIGAALVGLALTVLAFFTTKPERPPRRFLFPWVVGGFFMSIVWFFVIANELVALLVTFGTMLEIDPSILGLTVLAWGNSMGDLMANIALAYSGGDGVQIAISGCYAGPMFNTLIGLGISLVVGSWGSRPHAFAVPRDDSLYYTIAFLVTGLLWALIILPLKKMQPSKLLGVGLLTLYTTFLGFRLGYALGFVPISGW
eukprot:c17424_g1_i1 orf=416-2806(-)